MIHLQRGYSSIRKKLYAPIGKFFRRKKKHDTLTKRKVLRIFTISSVQGSSTDCCESKIIIKGSEMDNCAVKHDTEIIIRDLKLIFNGTEINLPI